MKLEPQYIYLEYRKDKATSDSASNPGIYFHAGPDYILHDRPPRPDDGFVLHGEDRGRVTHDGR